MFEVRSSVDSLRTQLEDGGFVWLTGIEDTFITAPHPTTGRTLDEYALTGHYKCWRADFELMRELGVRAARYGLPWHLINPRLGAWDFSWSDRVVERLLELGIAPVLDLVHYGVPLWIDGAFGNPSYDRRVEEYTVRVCERYGKYVSAYTPLNEPRITAWYTGKLGLWPPYRRGWRGFLAMLVAICKGIVRTTRAVERCVPGASIVHVDPADIYVPANPDAAPEATLRQNVGFLALDLVSGRVDRAHGLWGWLLAHGVAQSELEWFSEHKIALDIVGLNLYPLFSFKQVVTTGSRSRIAMRYATGELVEQLAELYYTRYRRPLMITETASEGSVARRAAWLESSVAAVARVRSRAIPLVGYTWWPLFALVAWSYRRGTQPISRYLKQMGLWNLAPGPAGRLDRVATPLVEAYRRVVASGAAAVGNLEPATFSREMRR